MKKHVLLVIFALVLGFTTSGYCQQAVSLENGDFTIDGITVGNSIKSVIAEKGKPSFVNKETVNSYYSYSNRYAFLTKADGVIWYISTNTLPTARNIKAGMTKQQMVEAYGNNFQQTTLANGENFEYLDEQSKIKIAFVINDKDIIMQIDCKKYD